MSRIDILLERPTQVHKWLGDPGGERFHVWLRDWHLSVLKTLRTSRDPIEIHRAQGANEVIERILGLRDEISQFQKEKVA